MQPTKPNKYLLRKCDELSYAELARVKAALSVYLDIPKVLEVPVVKEVEKVVEKPVEVATRDDLDYIYMKAQYEIYKDFYEKVMGNG